MATVNDTHTTHVLLDPALDVDPGRSDGAGPAAPRSSSITHGLAAARTAGGRYHPRQVVAGALVGAGVIAILVGWIGVGGTAEVWEQIPYLVSGGIGGAALIAVGLVVYLSWEHLEDRGAVTELTRRIEELEMGLAGELDALHERIDALAAPRTSRQRARV